MSALHRTASALTSSAAYCQTRLILESLNKLDALLEYGHGLEMSEVLVIQALGEWPGTGWMTTFDESASCAFS